MSDGTWNVTDLQPVLSSYNQRLTKDYTMQGIQRDASKPALPLHIACCEGLKLRIVLTDCNKFHDQLAILTAIPDRIAGVHSLTPALRSAQACGLGSAARNSEGIHLPGSPWSSPPDPHPSGTEMEHR